MKLRTAARFFGVALLAVVAQAHVGSPDVYIDGKAGPYQLFVTVRPPQVIPGVAELEIRSQTPGITQLTAVPVPITGPGAKFSPIPDKLTVSKQDAQFFTGALWMMAPGSWQVRITATGAKGEGVLSVPVASVARTTKKMDAGIGLMLSVLGLFLVGGVVAIAGASAREAKLEPGLEPDTRSRHKGKVAMAIAFVAVVGVLWGGNAWWSSEARNYGQSVYRPVQMKASLDSQGLLTLNLTDSGWLQPPKAQSPRRGIARLFLFKHSLDDLVLDHNHLMHLYALREPALDEAFHLHPDQVETGVFRLQLPDMPPGNYRLYADIVHANGFPETPVASVTIPPGLPGRPLAGDDSSAAATGWQQASTTATSYTLPDGYRMEWLRNNAPIHAREGMSFRFRLLDPQGHAPKDMALYMGMLGHAAFVKTDGTVFAHIHPMGTASMAAMTLAEDASANQTTGSMDDGSMDDGGMDMNDMPGMSMPTATLPNEVSFPYGLPTPGHYRIFVQMKHGNTIETGVFDTVAQ